MFYKKFKEMNEGNYVLFFFMIKGNYQDNKNIFVEVI